MVGFACLVCSILIHSEFSDQKLLISWVQFKSVDRKPFFLPDYKEAVTIEFYQQFILLDCR